MNESPSNVPEFSVSEISQAIKRTMEDAFDHVRIRGEIGRLTRPGSGHLYFDLKDDKSVISAIAWKGVASRWRFQPEQGLEVIVTGKLTTFPGQSKYQIIVESVEPAGVGALMALLEERRKKLGGEGLFDAERKQELPYLPRVIGVVTSPTGAVIRDILHRLADRFPTHVVVWPVRVQGETSAAEVARAINGFNALDENGAIPKPELLIVARGGGSVEDLWSFNEEIVVRAAADSMIALISAVGHETDVTLIDYAADKRAPTPTGAAEMAVPVRHELVAYVDDLGARQRAAARRITSSQRDRLRAAGAGLPRPLELLANARQRLDLATSRLTAALSAAANTKAVHLARLQSRLSPRMLERNVEDLGRRLADTERRLVPAMKRITGDKNLQLASQVKLMTTLSYKSTIARGYALVTDADGVLVRGMNTLSAGDHVTLEFADGKAQASILDGDAPAKKTTPPKPAAKSPAAKPKVSRNENDPGQSSLF